jgi:DNA-binding GntR family transcriptional regulator
MSLEEADAPDVALAQHEGILQAIMAGDAALAASHLERHFDGRAQRIATALGER